MPATVVLRLLSRLMPHKFVSRLACMLLLCLGGSALAQDFRETFTDGFTPALDWRGDLDAFVAEAGRLRLQDVRPTAPGVAKVWAPAPTRDSACWSLSVELQFAPSASNRARWWLDADRALDQPSVQGHYIQFGGISGSDDAFELIYTDGNETTVLAATSPGSAANDPVSAQVDACFGASGWVLNVQAVAGPTETVSAASVAPLAGVFTGFDLVYTATRSDLFFFDNLTVDPLFVDVVAPELVLAEAENVRTIRLVASETLAPSASSLANYTVAGNTVSNVSHNGNEIILQLASDLASGVATAITISTWSDLAGNASSPISTQVTYTAPRQFTRFDVLITEIMADPTPALGLPEVEYLELYNATSEILNLSSLSLIVGGRSTMLPDVLLDANSYLAFSADAGSDARFVQFDAAPTLTNSGTTLSLTDADGNLIDQVSYTPAWHVPAKDEGGYSLERIDLAVPCAIGRSNWTSSTALSGGTPSAPNAAMGTIEIDSLAIVGVELIGDTTLLVRTNRALRTSALSDAFNLSGNDLVSIVEQDLLGSYLLQLASPLQAGELISITLSSNAQSCLGSELVSRVGVVLGVAEEAEPGDWKLNEIMFDPLSGQGRWLELANVSDKVLSSSQLLLARLDDEGNVSDFVEPEHELLVAPGALMVYAADVERLQEEFPAADPTLLVASDLPSLSDAECLQLFDATTEEIYWTVCYDEDWHNRAYANTDGVSLERIDLDGAANEPSNWTSAASSSNFGTPTRRNSQARAGEQVPEGSFSLASQRISPDGDGFEDLLALDYAFEQAGVLARFEVFDAVGRPVLTSETDSSPGMSGTWTWDGVDDDGRVAAVGTYILRVSYFTPSSPREQEFLAFSLLLPR